MKRVLNFLIIFCIACNHKETELIIDNEVKAIGHINTDSSFDNEISFFDLNTNKLLYKANYKNNILNGVRTDYYSNGNVRSIQNYINGDIHGFTNFYDSLGNILSKQYRYYGIRAGHHINFKEEKIFEYGFYSLDNDLLFYINYDSLASKSITDLETSYFFFKERLFSNSSTLSNNFKKDFFIYIPQPPKFSFEYSIVVVDSSYKVLDVKEVLSKNKIWDSFILDTSQKNIAIKLTIIDSIKDNAIYTMFKKL